MKLIIEVHAVEKEEHAIDLLWSFPRPLHLACEDDDGRQTAEEEHEVAGVYEGGISKTNEEGLHILFFSGSLMVASVKRNPKYNRPWPVTHPGA